MEDRPDPAEAHPVVSELFASDLFETVMALARSLERVNDFDSLAGRMLSVILGFTGASSGMIYLPSDALHKLTLAAHTATDGAPPAAHAPSSEPDFLPQQVLGDRRAAFIEDALADPLTSEHARLFCYRARLCLPLIILGRPQGVLDLYLSQPRLFSAYERYLLEALAINLAALLTSARLFLQTQVANTRLMRLSEFGSRILTSETSHQALDLTVRYVLQATQADSAFMYLLNPKGEISLRYGLNQAGAVINEKAQPTTDATIQKVLKAGQPVVVTGLQPSAYKEIHPSLRKQGVRAFVALPIKRGASPAIGVLHVRFNAPHEFLPIELEGLLLYAAQATGAIEYLRLLEDSRRREVDLGVMVDTAHMLISTLDLDELLRQVAIRMCWVTGMSSCAISTFIRNPDQVRLLAQYSGLGEKDDMDLNEVFLLADYPATRRVLESSEPAIISDEGPQSDPAEVALLHRQGYRTLLMLPLLAGGEPVGLIELYSRKSGHVFRFEDLKRLRALSEQVALALINARHYTNEQQARLTAETLRKAAAVLNSTLELNQVLDMILEQLQQVVYFDSAGLMLIEHSHYRILAVRDHPFPEEAMAINGPVAGDPLVSAVVNSRDFLIISDAQADLRFKRLGNTDYVRGWMAIPLISRDEVIGILTIDSRQVNAYTEADARLAMAFADHASVAITNARLYHSEHEHRNLAEALGEISLALSSSLKENATLDLLLEQIRRVVPYDSGAVLILDGEMARMARQVGFDQYGTQDLEGVSLLVDSTANLKHMAATLRPAAISDVLEDPGWVHTPVSAHVRSWVGAPLVARGRLLGFLALDKAEPNYYTQEHASTLGILAGHAALALQNAITFGEVMEASITDFLTGAFNHRYFQTQIRSELERAHQIDQPLSLLMLDLDHFKRVNDNYGHLCGDQVLQHVALRLKHVLRTSDLLARYGGEEFAVILPYTHHDAALRVAKRLHEAICGSQFTTTEAVLPVNISVGVASFPDHASHAQDLIACADRALYQAKETGRNRVCSFAELISEGDQPA